MKKSFLKSLTILLVLSMAMTILVLPSCKSLEPTTLLNTTQDYSTSTQVTVDTILLRDSVYRHDSVIYRERTIHDTVYITKEVYRDQRLSTLDIQHSTKADTVVVTEYRDRVIEHPPERYIPPFYKRCTLLFWLILATSALYMIGKFYLKRLL